MKDKIVFGARTKPTSDVDNAFIKKNESYLFIGKKDKSISVLDFGNQILLTPTSRFDDATAAGEIDIHAAVIKFGTVLVNANAVETKTFDTPFPNKCFVIVGSQKLNDHVSNIMLEPVDKTSYKISISGGIGSEFVSWIAIGN